MVLAQIDGEIVRQFLEQTGQAIGNFFLTGLGGFFFRIIRVAFPLIAILLLVKCTASMMRKRRPLKYAACFLNLASAERIPFVYAENVIGRSKASDIVLGIPTVSRNHAVVSIKEGFWYICDTESKAGIYVNEEKISGKRQLHTGDVVRLGGVSLLFEGPETRKAGE